MPIARIPVGDVTDWPWRALHWALAQQPAGGGFVAFLTGNRLSYPNDPFPSRLFVGAKRVVSFLGENTRGGDALGQLYDAYRSRPSWLVGYLGYDLKNQYEDLQSRHPNRLGFPDLYFAEPEWIIDFDDQSVTVQGEGDAEAVARALTSLPDSLPAPAGDLANDSALTSCRIQGRVTSDEYQEIVGRIQEYIRSGEVYELNYCVEFFAEACRLDPLQTYRALTQQSPMPFSAFMQLGSRYVLGASPERFLQKRGQRLVSQPIKGTIRRGQTPEEDAILRAQLLGSEKERAENLMIVDLVRNDLARSAETGSVRVEELFGVYGFRQVNQLISTVSATLRDGVSWTDAIRHAFPMGSMTGAPKIRAMQLIDELEASRRGVYSGALGFITPTGDFDFNVVIRTLLYDSLRQYASFSVGSAITYDADPAQEWAECLLKGRAIREVLEQCAATPTR